MATERRVARWARIAAWPLCGIGLLVLGVLAATGFLFSPEGLVVALSGTLVLVVFAPVAIRGTEPRWLTTNEPHVGNVLFQLVPCAAILAFQREALLRLSPAFVILVLVVCLVFFGGRILRRRLPMDADLVVMLLALLALFSAPLWTASLAPASSGTDRLLGVCAAVSGGAAVKMLFRRPEQPATE